MNLQINSEKLDSELQELAAFSETLSPAITRIVFSEQDVAARAWLKQKCLAAGLAIREDAIGNTFARWEGTDANSGSVATGSHIDAIPNAGRFDGTVGVIGGLEAIRALQKSGFTPKRSIELILFTSEEPTRFGIGCLGSRLLSGVLKPERAQTFKDREGNSLEDLRRCAGFTGDLHSVQLQPGHYTAFVELHIEQGPRLESQKLDIGIVTSIAAPAGMRVSITGSGGHAGGVLMRDRRDAFVGAAEMAIAVEAAALSTGSPDSVATTGICRVFPGAVNSVPSQVNLEIDVRDSELARRDSIVAAISEECKAIGRRRQLEVELETVNSDAPAACDPAIIGLISNACGEAGLTHMKMVSRAYHDSLFMSHLAPTSMIFIPCHLGISHRPDEFASLRDISNGALILAHTLAALASQ
jgi:N-carbamoyl-L-amino-acid hydrolase